MNKKISTSIAITITLACAVLVGGLAVGCYLLYTPKVEIAEFKPTEKTPPAAETADWKTYRNEEYGFEIKYPKDWVFKESKDEEDASIFFHTLKRDEQNMYYKEFFFMFIKRTTYTDIQKWFDNEYKDRHPEMVPDKEIVIINDNEWLYTSDPITYGGCFGEAVRIIKDSRLYTINNYCVLETDEVSTIDNMVSTFRFLE